MFCHPEHYKLGIWPMQEGEIIEVDTLKELVELDENYREYLNGGTKNEW